MPFARGVLGPQIGGKYTRPLVPMFLFENFQIIINLNPYAFFVPIFNTEITDLNVIFKI